MSLPATSTLLPRACPGRPVRSSARNLPLPMSAGFAAYPALLPTLLQMDGAQVLSWDNEHNFHLSGVSPPFLLISTSELKRFGLRIGKFVNGDSNNLMSATAFCLSIPDGAFTVFRLSRSGAPQARFCPQTPQNGREIPAARARPDGSHLTTYISDGSHSRYPKVEK